MLFALLILASCADVVDTGTPPEPPAPEDTDPGPDAELDTAAAEPPCSQWITLEPQELVIGAAGAANTTVHGCAVGVGISCDTSLQVLADTTLREGDVVGVRLSSSATPDGEASCLVRWAASETTQVIELVVRW